MADRAQVGGGKETSVFSQVRSAVNSFLANLRGENDWFPPNMPPDPVAPAGTGVRSFDYPVGVNLDYTPRATEQIDFASLRLLADSYDLLRLVIETRKDQVKRQQWCVRVKREDGESDQKHKQRSAKDERVKELSKFFEFPDKEHSFKEWVGMLLEEVLVIDALSILPRYTYGGDLFGLDIVDGSTIHRVITTEGKTPQPPLAAYQQIIKGMPSVNITAPNGKDIINPQLIYRPRNKRVSKLYGYSPVEQIIMTVNIALRRQISQLQYYTEGNMPDAIIGTPENWTPDQVKQFELWWNSVFSGNTGERRKAKFVPGDVDKRVFPTKPPELKDELDDWLARIIAFAFSISPQQLIKAVNKATAETSVEQSMSEGLEPILDFIEDVMNFVIKTYFAYEDIEFAFAEDSGQLDPKTQAEVDTQLVSGGIMTVDEARANRGLEPKGANELFIVGIGATKIEDVMNPPEPEPAGGQPDKNTPPTGKVSKKKTIRVSAGTVTKQMRGDIPRMRRSVTKFFTKEKKRIADVISEAYESATAKSMKAAEDELADEILKELDLDDWTKLSEEISKYLNSTYRSGGKQALADLLIASDAAAFDVIDKFAVEYAEKRAAELVGKKIVNGKLVNNPDARWAITTTTRNKIRDLIVTAITDGLSPADLKKAIQESAAFSSERADMIARTELAKANVTGNLGGWLASGVVLKKKSLLSDDHDHDDECDDNYYEGEIDIEEPFPSGDMASPYHPLCQCDVVAITANDEDDE